MKKLVEGKTIVVDSKIEDVDDGFIALLGERITVMCACYFYTGKLIGVNNTCILLEDPAIVYETGAFTDKHWKDCQSMNVKQWYIQTSLIESFGVLK